MNESTPLSAILAKLTAAARGRKMNDTQWSRASGVPKETLSRLRRRTSCDFATLASLAASVGARVDVSTAADPAATADGQFPASIDRSREQQLAELLASGAFDVSEWRAAGPGFFMAGLAVLGASLAGLDRRKLLALAEEIHPGISLPDVFARWLARSPVRPTRFAPLVRQRLRHAA